MSEPIQPVDGYLYTFDSSEGRGVWRIPGAALSDPAFGTPSVTVKLTASAGTALTALRSDAELALDTSIAPTWSGQHTFSLSPVLSTLTASRVMVSDSSKKPASSTVTQTALETAFGNQSANQVWAGPTSGGAAAPSFRALVAADIPDLSAVYQPKDGTLTALAAFNSNGLLAQTAADTFAARTLTGPAAGLTVTNGNGVSGNPTLALANDLAALEALGSTGLAVRTAADTWAQRSVTVTVSTGLSVTNGDGVSGNITLAGVDASTTVKGVASFSSTNFSVSSGAVNTVQNINIGASPQFVGLTLTGNLSTAGVASSLIPSATDTYDLGSSTKLWRKGWVSELDAVLFAQNTVSVLGGWLLVTKSEGAIPMGQDVGTGDGSIDFGQSMTANDFVLFRAAGQVEYVQVGSVISGTRYNVTRNLDGTGANAWPAGSVYAVLGNTTNGRIEINANATPRVSLIKQGSAYNTQTELLRIGDLNGEWGYSSETYGFAAGQYNTTQAWLTLENTNGLRLGSGTTAKIQLNPNGSGYLANSSISWDTSGNLTVAANATIAGWSVTSTKLTSGVVSVASGADIANVTGTAEAWFGRSSTGYTGMFLKGTTGASFSMIAGNSGIGSAGRPYMTISDGTYYRVVLGELNAGWGADGASNSMGMKVWDSSGNKLVEFSDVRNVISGWTISTSSISSTGVALRSGGSANIAFGSTPPTANNSGTGVFVDATGFYGLSGGTSQVSISAADGKLSAGGGAVRLDANGIVLDAGAGAVNSLNWVPAGSSFSLSNTVAQINLNRSGAGNNVVFNLSGGLLAADTGGYAEVILNASNRNSILPGIRFASYGSAHATQPNKGYVTISAPNGTLINNAGTPGTAEAAALTVLELNSTTGALLLSRMTTTQRDALTAVNGMLVYNTTTNKFQGYAGGAWVDLH